MKRSILFAIILFHVNSISSQNLVSNPDFEICQNCGRFGNPGVEFFGTNGSNVPVDWFAPSPGSSDIRPTYPRSGKNHGGFFSIGKYEYLANVLHSKLIAGAKYKVSFYVGLDPKQEWSIDEIGFVFHAGFPLYTQFTPLSQLTRAFTTPDGEFFSSTYKQYQFEYTANGTEDYIIIGRFKDFGAGDTLNLRGNRTQSLAPYTNIDDVSIELICQQQNILGENITLCEGVNQTITPLVDISKAEKTWYNGDTTSNSITTGPNDEIVWIEIQENGCPAYRDSLVINRIQLVKNVIAESIDTFRCDETNRSIVASEDPKILSYLWNTGSTSSSISADTAGTYSVIVNTLCGEVKDEIRIVVTPLLDSSLIKFPNVITANNDGKNDAFEPYYSGDVKTQIKNYSLEIFNRWGDRVFSTNSLIDSWLPTGKHSVDTYLFLANFELKDCDDKIVNIKRKGTFSLIR